MQKTIGIFGASFNPIHDGHIAMAMSAYHEMNLDEVWLMPTPQNPLKLITGMASFEDRLKMCQLAAKGMDWLKVTDFEQQNHANNPKNETLFTLRALSKAHPDCRFVWLMGADNLRQFHLWHGWQEIVQEYAMGIFNRADQCDNILETTVGKQFAGLLHSNPNKLKESVGWSILTNENLIVSSTALRAQLSNGQAPKDINPYVLQYIREHKLYQEASWYIPEIKLNDIASLQIKSGRVPTLYDENNIYSENMGSTIHDCDSLIKFTGETIRDVVALLPERAALHALIVTLSTQYKIDSYDQLVEKTRSLYETVILPKVQESRDIFEAIEKNADQLATAIKNGTKTNSDHDLEVRLAKVMSHSEWKNLAPNEQARMKNLIVTNTLLKSEIEEAANTLVTDSLADKIIMHKFGLLSLEQYSPQDRKTFLIVGGPAVGKNRVIQSLSQGDLSIHAFSLGDFCKINPDFYKEILLPSSDLGPYMPYYGSLTHDESFLISDKIFLAWQKMAKSGSAPNVLVDAARPHPWIMDILASGNGFIDVFVATCDIEKALQRNYKRGQETRRFMPTQKLLGFHQSVYPMFVDAMNKYHTNAFLLDTNGDTPSIAAIWQQGKNPDIRLPRTLENFVKTSQLNAQAVNNLQLGI